MLKKFFWIFFGDLNVVGDDMKMYGLDIVTLMQLILIPLLKKRVWSMFLHVVY